MDEQAKSWCEAIVGDPVDDIEEVEEVEDDEEIDDEDEDEEIDDDGEDEDEEVDDDEDEEVYCDNCGSTDDVESFSLRTIYCGMRGQWPWFCDVDYCKDCLADNEFLSMDCDEQAERMRELGREAFEEWSETAPDEVLDRLASIRQDHLNNMGERAIFSAMFPGETNSYRFWQGLFHSVCSAEYHVDPYPFASGFASTAGRAPTLEELAADQERRDREEAARQAYRAKRGEARKVKCQKFTQEFPGHYWEINSHSVTVLGADGHTHTSARVTSSEYKQVYDECKSGGSWRPLVEWLRRSGLGNARFREAIGRV